MMVTLTPTCRDTFQACRRPWQKKVACFLCSVCRLQHEAVSHDCSKCSPAQHAEFCNAIAGQGAFEVHWFGTPVYKADIDHINPANGPSFTIGFRGTVELISDESRVFGIESVGNGGTLTFGIAYLCDP